MALTPEFIVAYVQRLREQQIQLGETIVRLEALIVSPQFQDLPEIERGYCMGQRSQLEAVANTLRMRIEGMS